MPLHQGYEQKDGERKGYYQWGTSGTKYYYTPGHAPSRSRAKNNAREQQQAARASGYDG
jgi:hypothetical protein